MQYRVTFYNFIFVLTFLFFVVYLIFNTFVMNKKEGRSPTALQSMLLGINIFFISPLPIGIDILNGTQKEQQQRKDIAKKTYKIGDSIKGDGVTYTLESVEYADTSSEYASEPDNGVALKVNLSFKNENDEQVLVDSSDFSIKVNGENFKEWYGTDDTNADVSHQLNKDNTANGYIYYDVPDSEIYTLELNAMPDLNHVKGKWNIKKIRYQIRVIYESVSIIWHQRCGN